jgi:methylmalonyl-CoA/ethylmalonyl-CoA epimerase
MVIDHIGIVVRSIEHGIQQWQTMFGYRLCSKIVTNSRQRVRVAFLSKQGSLTIKLLEPLDGSSPASALAAKGGGLHHICFRCAGLKSEIPVLQAKGARLLVAPQPGEAFNDREIAFLFAGNNLNIELIDTTEKAGWVSSPESFNPGLGNQPPLKCVE